MKRSISSSSSYVYLVKNKEEQVYLVVSSSRQKKTELSSCRRTGDGGRATLDDLDLVIYRLQAVC